MEAAGFSLDNATATDDDDDELNENTVDDGFGFDTAPPNVNPVVVVVAVVGDPNENPPELTAPKPLLLPLLLLLLEEDVGNVAVDPNVIPVPFPVPNWKPLLPVLANVPPVPKLKDFVPAVEAVVVVVVVEATGAKGLGVSQAAHRLVSLLLVMLHTEHFQLSTPPPI